MLEINTAYMLSFRAACREADSIEGASPIDEYSWQKKQKRTRRKPMMNSMKTTHWAGLEDKGRVSGVLYAHGKWKTKSDDVNTKCGEGESE